MNTLMENVNLDEIVIKQNNHLKFSFSNSYNGTFYKRFDCSNIIKCCMENDAYENEIFLYIFKSAFIWKQCFFVITATGNQAVYSYGKEKLPTMITYTDGTYEEKKYDEWQNIIYERDRNGSETIVSMTVWEICWKNLFQTA